MTETTSLLLGPMLMAQAEQQPDRDILTFEHLSLDGGATPDEIRTYADLATNANRIAAGLIELGMDRGDRFGLMMRNHPEFVEALIAASISATVAVPIDARTKADKLRYMISDSGCSGVICADECLSEVLAVMSDLPQVRWILVLVTGLGVDLSSNSVVPISPLANLLSTEAATVDVRLESGRDPLQIVYTSGTTGDPKGIVYRNERTVSFALLGAVAGYQPEDRPYTGLSLTHGNAQTVTMGPALALGVRSVLSRRFTKSKLWDVCRAYGVTTYSLLGGMATAIYSEPRRSDDADNPVRRVLSAGMPAALWPEFEKRFDIEILEWYGAMEGGFAVNPVGVGPLGSMGKPMGGTEMKVLDDNDVECPPFVSGEICSRPEGGTPDAVEYHNNPQASKAKTHGGWLRSGDVGHTDEDGWFFFDYRKGGGLRRNGDFISPGFVERVIAEHENVDDVFVYGIPAASGAPGESDVVAAVVAAEPESFEATSVFARCKDRLESNFVPSYIQLVDQIPKTASEKPQERYLKAEFDHDSPTVFSP
ncbi:MAG: AMP-binding protein [Acidimicrobiales bacterium]